MALVTGMEIDDHIDPEDVFGGDVVLARSYGMDRAVMQRYTTMNISLELTPEEIDRFREDFRELAHSISPVSRALGRREPIGGQEAVGFLAALAMILARANPQSARAEPEPEPGPTPGTPGRRALRIE